MRNSDVPSTIPSDPTEHPVDHSTPVVLDAWIAELDPTHVHATLLDLGGIHVWSGWFVP